MLLPRNAERSLDEAPGHRRGLVCGSPAINHGNPGVCKDNFDSPLDLGQCVFPRVQNCDSGGYEFQAEICGLYQLFTCDQ